MHDCTITLFEYLFCDSALGNHQDLRNSKEDRVDMQYYTHEISVDLEQVKNKTKKFVLEIENVIDGLNSERERAIFYNHPGKYRMGRDYRDWLEYVGRHRLGIDL